MFLILSEKEEPRKVEANESLRKHPADSKRGCKASTEVH